MATLKLKAELYSERIARIQFQSQILQGEFGNAQELLKKVQAEIAEIEKAKTEEDKKKK